MDVDLPQERVELEGDPTRQRGLHLPLEDERPWGEGHLALALRALAWARQGAMVEEALLLWEDVLHMCPVISVLEAPGL